MASPRPPRAADPLAFVSVEDARVLIVEARFYDDIADELLADVAKGIYDCTRY